MRARLKVVCPTAFDDELGEVLFEIDEEGNTKTVPVGTIFWTRRGFSVEIDVSLGIPCDKDLADRIQSLVRKAYGSKYYVRKIAVWGKESDPFVYEF